ncbi:hypothetical protein IBF22_09315 [Francisella tularensis]|nr:hypothetical protein [Francisella tularensis]MBK2152459.1 hypothetical protein [Francisella tularensis]
MSQACYLCRYNLTEENSLIPSQTSSTDNQVNKIISLNESERIILGSIDRELTTIDKIIIKSKLPYNQVTSILFELELKSLIESIPGGYINIQ